jgi:hypothetical protein
LSISEDIASSDSSTQIYAFLVSRTEPIGVEDSFSGTNFF